jgi:Zn-dependent protease with chaperone function
MTAALRAMLALALVVSWYAVAGTLLVLCLAFDVLMLWAEAQPTAAVSPIPLLAVAGSFAVIVAIVHGVLSVSRSAGLRADSVTVAREDAPVLWQTVDDLARRVGVTPPVELRLVADANASVTEQARMLGLLPGRRSMRVGVPLLLGLNTAELRAALCHELGHYGRGHIRFGALTWRGSAALSETRAHLRQSADKSRFVAPYSALLQLFIAGYANVYDRLTLAMRRQQEFAADATAARIVGAAATASALRTAHSLDAAWADFRVHLLDPSLRAGFRPVDPFSAFEVMLADPDYRDALADHRRSLPDRPRSPWASHPGLAQRIAALPGDAEIPAPPETLPATVTFGITRELSAGLTAGVLAPRGGRGAPDVLPWARWLEKLAERQAMAPVRALAAAVRVSGGSPAPATGTLLSATLQALDLGRGADLAAGLPGRRPGGGTEDDVIEAVTMLIGHHLATARHATWLVGWTGHARLICQNTTAEDMRELVQAAVEDQAEVSRLRLHLAELGIAPETPITLPDTENDAATVTIRSAPRVNWHRELRIGLRANRGLLTFLFAILAVVLVMRLAPPH